MAIFGKKQTDEVVKVESKPPQALTMGKSGPSPAVPTPGGAGQLGQPEGSKLIVGPNIRLSGSEIADCDTVIVEGRVEATVDGRVMQITETGMFSGTVSLDMAEIRGQFQGELTVRKRLTVCGTGKVKGKIRYGTLVVEEGGELSGDIDSLNPAQATAAIKAPSPPGTPATPGGPGKPDTPMGRF